MQRFLLFIIFSLIGLNLHSMIHVVFRYDDYVLRENSFQNSLLAVFETYNTPLICGIIPATYNASTDITFLKKLYQEKKVIIAQHGYRHEDNKLNSFKSEFCGSSFGSQIVAIRGGQAVLKDLGFESSIFIPPFNTADNQTYRSLYKLGYKLISTSGSYNSPYVSSLPATSTFDQLLADIDLAKKQYEIEKSDLYIVCLFHEYEINCIKDVATLLNKVQMMDNVVTTWTEKDICKNLIKKDSQKPFFSLVKKDVFWRIKCVIKRLFL